MKIGYEKLGRHDLRSGDVLLAGAGGALAGEPVSAAFGGGNRGGFRILGNQRRGYRSAVLFSTFHETEWPDSIDAARRRVVYYGDNRRIDRDLHASTARGNRLLSHAFRAIHVSPHERSTVPPFFICSTSGESRDVLFHGIAAPGAPGLTEEDDLVAIWRTCGRDRFLNYRATFTLLQVDVVDWRWIHAIRGQARPADARRHAPPAWIRWVETGRY